MVVFEDQEIKKAKVPENGRVKYLAKILEPLISQSTIKNIGYIEQNYWMQREMLLYDKRCKELNNEDGKSKPQNI